VGDERLRELERRCGDSPEDQQNYLAALTRTQGFYPPAVIYKMPGLVDCALAAICGNEYAAFALEATEFWLDNLLGGMDRAMAEVFITSTTSPENVRRMAQLAAGGKLDAWRDAVVPERPTQVDLTH
jgi:hypothetical protein